MVIALILGLLAMAAVLAPTVPAAGAFPINEPNNGDCTPGTTTTTRTVTFYVNTPPSQVSASELAQVISGIQEWEDQKTREGVQLVNFVQITDPLGARGSRPVGWWK